MHAAAELYCLQRTAVFQVGVPWAYAASGNPHTRVKAAAGTHGTLATLGAPAPRGRTPPAFACSRPGANRNLPDSRSPSSASWERRAPGNTSPAVDCPLLLPDMGRLPGRSNFLVGRHPPSSQAADLQLFIVSAQPARNTRTRTQVPRHRRRRGGVGNLGIVQLFLHCPTREPGSQKGGA